MRMRTRRRLRALPAMVAVLACMSLVAACGSNGGDSASGSSGGSAAAKGPFVVGAALGLTGDCAQGDVSALEGIKYEVKQVNAAGGVGGRQIKLISEDMQSKPALAGRVAQELIDKGAQVILGPCLAGNAIPTAEAASARGIPTILVTNTVPLPKQVMDSGLVFFAGFSDNVQAAAGAEYALEQGYKSALLVESKDISYTSNTPKWFGEAFEHGGGKLVGDVSYKIGQTDFSAQVTKIANVKPAPDVIYSALFMPDLGIFVPQLRAAGVKSALIGADAFESQEFIDTAKQDAEGVALSTHGLAEPGTPFGELIAGIAADTGKAPEANGYAGLGADAVQLLQKAAAAAKSSDPKALAKAILTFKDVQLVAGKRTYAGTDGSPTLPISIAKIQDGKYVPAEDIQPSWVPTP